MRFKNKDMVKIKDLIPYKPLLKALNNFQELKDEKLQAQQELEDSLKLFHESIEPFTVTKGRFRKKTETYYPVVQNYDDNEIWIPIFTGDVDGEERYIEKISKTDACKKYLETQKRCIRVISEINDHIKNALKVERILEIMDCELSKELLIDDVDFILYLCEKYTEYKNSGHTALLYL